MYQVKVLRAVYSIYNYTLIANCMIFIIFELIAFRRALEDVPTFLSQIAMMFTHVICMVKLWMLIYRKEQVAKIKAKLQNKHFEYVSIDDFQPGKKMHKETLFIKFVSMFIFAVYVIVGILGHFTAAIMVNKNSSSGTFSGNVSCQSFIPYNFYYPFNTSTPRKCHYALIYMDINLDICAFYIALLDMIFVLFLHVLAIQLNILSKAFITIRKRCLRKMKMDLNIRLFRDADHKEFEQEMYSELVHCTKHLCLLIGVRQDIESLFSFITLFQVTASLLISASCLFAAATVPVSSPNFFSQLQYFSAILSQIFIYCWFGNKITHASSELPTAIYKSDWLGCSRRFKQAMLMSMKRMERPLYVSIGKFTPLSLSTLLAVLRGSFSYFTLFQRAGQI
ncbi:odorant receptor 94b-like isoform X2 [Euwallacea fornicatus]|uniref:odorant receptor 94b-like isoform X2 n=1 Tax=Euwallacea fornicatus TaxID=995702 RepID=UPI00338EDE9B